MKHLNNKFYIVSAVIILMPSTIFASDESTATVINTGPINADNMMQLVIGLMIVLACIVVLAWIAKRMNHLQSSTGGMLKIIGGLNIGTKEKIVLLQVGSEQILIGVTQSNISKLHLLKTPIENDDANTKAQKNFSHRLAEKMDLSKKFGFSDATKNGATKEEKNNV